jgi:hypothetical protein
MAALQSLCYKLVGDIKNCAFCEGKTVQKAVEESTGNYLRTYYIYDAYNRTA